MAERHDQFEILINATATEVWDLLTTSEGLASWFGGRASIDLRVDGSRVVGWGEDVQIDGRIDAIDPGRRLRVVYEADGKETGAEEWLVSNDADGVVRLTLITSLSDEGIDDWDGFYGDIRRGWNLFLRSLQFALETAVTPSRRVECRYVPASGSRHDVRDWAQSVVRTLETADMELLLDDPPHSLLMGSTRRSLLIDIEGNGPSQVVYVQASAHGDGVDSWLHGAVQAFTTDRNATP